MGRGRLEGGLGDAVTYGEGPVCDDIHRKHPLSTLRTGGAPTTLLTLCTQKEGKDHCT